MTAIPFGNSEEFAVVFFDRRTKTCIVHANSDTYLDDAFAVVHSLRADNVVVVAPRDTHKQYPRLIQNKGLEVYEYF